LFSLFSNPCSFVNISVFMPFSYSIYSFVPCFCLCPFRCPCVLSVILSLLFLYILSSQMNLHIADVVTKLSPQISGRKTVIPADVCMEIFSPSRQISQTISRPFHCTSLPIYFSLIILQFDVVYFQTHSINRDHAATWVDTLLRS